VASLHLRPGLLTQTLRAARNRMFGRPHAEAWLAARSLRSRLLPGASAAMPTLLARTANSQFQ
jgi:hypothetical protein